MLFQSFMPLTMSGHSSLVLATLLGYQAAAEVQNQTEALANVTVLDWTQTFWF
jgi:hypothetical protein